MHRLGWVILLLIFPVLAGCSGNYSSSSGSCLPGNIPAGKGVIFGHVTAEGGGAIAGATVYVEITGGQRIQDSTDAAGCYVLAVIAGAYQVVCEAGGYAKRTASSGSIAIGASVNLDFVLAR